MAKKKETLCVCGSDSPYAVCCEPYHRESTYAETAEALMRSRYAAFVLFKPDYLINTWHETTRPANLALDRTQKWIGLKIIGTKLGGPADDIGEVEFVARFKVSGKAYRLHERSRFRKEQQRWYYVDGDLFEKHA